MFLLKSINASFLRRTILFIALVILLASVYMFTYSGRIESGDSLMYFDATASLVRFNDLFLDLTLWFNPPGVDNFDYPYPLGIINPESWDPILQPHLAFGLYWLADKLPGLGLVHTVWLFNIGICALVGGIMFLYALTLGYRESTAVLGALTLGITTIVWPYSKTFFRDPLMLLLVFLVGFFLERLRQSRFRSPWATLGVILAVLGSLHTKTTIVLAFPGLAMIVLPTLPKLYQQRAVRLALRVLLIVLLIIPVVLAFGDFTGLADRYHVLGRRVLVSELQTALQGYLFSIGGSIWGTSPVVLLAIPGSWLLYRQKQQRYIWVALFILLGYAGGYAALIGQHWFGGLSWPPRLLLPIVPFLMLVVLPVLDRLTTRSASRWLWGVVAVLILYSVWVQLSAVSLEWGCYPEALPPESGRLVEWGPGLNQIRYLRWVIIPGLWSKTPLDFAWVRLNVPGWAVAFTALALGCGVLLWRMLRSPQPGKRLWVFGIVLPGLFILFTGLGLCAIYADPVYNGDNAALHQMVDIIDQETQPGDWIMLNSNHYERFFLNFGKLDNPRVITLFDQPGERPSLEQPAEVVSDNPDELLTSEMLLMLVQLAERYDRLWLLMETGPFVSWSVRPIERFMTVHYYPVREIQTDPPDPNVRLLEYSTIVNAPDPYTLRGPEHQTDFVFGETVQLTGFELPAGDTFAPGAVLPISFYWQTDTVLETDYTVAWKMTDATGFVVAQGMDSQPAGGFAPTHEWQPGVPVWDNRALQVPSDLPAGDYQLWVLLYAHMGDGSIQNLPVDGDQVMGAGDIAVLPVTITIDT